MDAQKCAMWRNISRKRSRIFRSDSLGENAKMTMANAASVILYSLPIILALPIFRWDTSLGPTSFHQSWQGSTIQFLDSRLLLVELLDQKTQVYNLARPTNRTGTLNFTIATLLKKTEFNVILRLENKRSMKIKPSTKVRAW